MAISMYVIVTHVLLLTLGYHARWGLALKTANIATLVGKAYFELNGRRRR
jgi:hypothetical protein